MSNNKVLLSHRLLPVQENFLLKFEVEDENGAEKKQKTVLVVVVKYFNGIYNAITMLCYLLSYAMFEHLL